MELIINITEEIIKKHLELQHKQLGTLELAISIGEMLSTTKEEIGHGKFTPWVQENLPFSIRTAQKYMNVFSKKDLFHKLGANGLNEAYLLISPVEEEDKDVHIHKNPTYSDTDENGMVDVTPDDAHGQTSFRDYWDHLGPLIEKMDSVHKRLKGLRSSTTPNSLGSMFGNIMDMANVLRTWDPEKMSDCVLCDGEGCIICLDGKIGVYKESGF
ncbi:MAG: DUF3102 domain-containing protein [Candidatus Heimdallarchaeota archaeon]|nr:DUF3102 domain-containing protein [Candidatus Heimdallarchaeota archaeon]